MNISALWKMRLCMSKSGKAKEQQSPGSREDPRETPTDITRAELCVTGPECWPRWFLLLTVCLRSGADIYLWIGYCHPDCWEILLYSLIFHAMAFTKYRFCPTAGGRNLLVTLTSFHAVLEKVCFPQACDLTLISQYIAQHSGYLGLFQDHVWADIPSYLRCMSF